MASYKSIQLSPIHEPNTQIDSSMQSDPFADGIHLDVTNCYQYCHKSPYAQRDNELLTRIN
ncbi:hypothetical protein BLOT_007026 [Blomia tropicalis]|nr:hypothetical protein BLOT_007026 [Blomia tropicalis]